MFAQRALLARLGDGGALRFVVDLAMRPQLGEAEVRAMMEEAKANVIDEFARACRVEMSALT